jgi:NitT/TauT family transport system ATP-binding protein
VNEGPAIVFDRVSKSFTRPDGVPFEAVRDLSFSIARAFAGRPDILLCDEPFSALDEHTGNALRDEFRELLRETGATGVFITHSIEEALRLGGRLIVFERPARIAYEAHSLAGLSDAEREAVRAGIRQVLAADVAA